jgi:hypothetical protein
MGPASEAQFIQSHFIAPATLAEGFFDHLIRLRESYSEKWEYVRQNPVRAGLVSKYEGWPWQGEFVRIEG